ncbi:MAG: hypothetical protein K5764_09880 [Prevotella sp.]|nr:hypothetical protein [Prevotella sp.]
MKAKEKYKSLLMMIVLLSVALLTSCSKGDDGNDNSSGGNNGGGIKPDPGISVLSDIKYELSPTAVLVPEATAKQISSVDTTNHKLTLPANADKPEEGQCLIINTATKQLPNGLLAKISSVNEGSNGYEITYKDAELKDAFKEIEIPEQYIPLGEYVQHVYDHNGKEIQFARATKTRASGTETYGIVLPEVAWPIDKGIELTPKMTIELLMRYVFMFGDSEISYAGIKLDADVTVGADLAAELGKTKALQKKIHVLTIICGAIPIGPILLTPTLSVDFVVKTEGKITLEASMTYERSMHASMVYQKGAGLTGDFELEPEAEDALKYTFGPKFEGGIAYGFSMGGNIGIYGKTLALRNRMDILKKTTISGKLDLAAFTGTAKDWLTPYDITAGDINNIAKEQLRILEYAKKWKFGEFESLMLNESYGVTVGWDITTIGVDVASKTLPEVSVPIESMAICPQVKIDEKDFMTFDGNDVTLKLHHTSKSFLDKFTEFRAEFKRVNAKSGEIPITKMFDFDDEKRNLLVAEVKGTDVNSTITATLNGEDDYEIVVYMDVLGIQIPIFEGKAKKNTETDLKIVKITSVRLMTEFKDKRNDSNYTDAAPVDFYCFSDNEYKVTQDEDKLHVEVYHKGAEYYYTSVRNMSFDLTGFTGDCSKSKIENLKYNLDYEYLYDYTYVDEFGRTQHHTDDYGRMKEIDNVKCTFSPLPPMNVTLYPNILYPGYDKNVNVGVFSYGGTGKDGFNLIDYSHKETIVNKEESDEHYTYEAVSSDDNSVKLNIEFVYE